MLKDEFGYCVACFFDPCRCFGKDTESACSRCRELREEITALRREVNKLKALGELERERKVYLEHELLKTRVPAFRK